jgi:histidinol phosphatase-like enzyme
MNNHIIIGEQIKEIIIEYDKLPLVIVFKNKDGIIKKYILKTNNEKTTLLLNKKDF